MSLLKLLTVWAILINISGCQKNKKSTPITNTKATSCDLQEIVKEYSIDIYGNHNNLTPTPNEIGYALALSDFTAENPKEEIIDSEGTNWTKQALDNFRFVFNAGTGNRCEECINQKKSELLVYKNNLLYKKYRNIIVHDKQIKKVDRKNCTFRNNFDQTLTYSIGENVILTTFINGESHENSGHFEYFHDTKLKYSGIFVFGR